ncbi:C/D box methylation guide ribonucleoprotein complex aNOP56 subunit [Fervidicoccus sp.]|uniref:C/D box methylation guide ribonucleoprotein complex aNOP56 subunit n=1 Tax=Fervidicoccus sp. TaxID=2060324 RepID=UPI003D0AA58C
MMKKYLTQHIVGAFLIDEKGEVIKKSFSNKDIDENVEEMLQFESGNLTKQIIGLIEDISSGDTVVVETDALSRALLKQKPSLNVVVEKNAEVFRTFRGKIREIAISGGFFKGEDEFQMYIHQFNMEYTRRKLRKAAQKRDQLAAQAIRAIDDLDKTYNLFVIRLREWYSVHFPELDNLVPNHEQYVRLVAELGHRDNFEVSSIVNLGFSQDKAEKLTDAAKKSIGADLSDFDIKPIQTLARMAWDTYVLREDLAGYIESVMKEVAPNITALVGSLLGARLISLAGSLENLAKLPASTIQVLGAEKALFRALKTGSRPPKHGIIFQYPEIHKAPRWQRGKMARTLAAKLAIAAKVDAFTGRWIGDKLVEDLQKRLEEIKKIYAKPPAKKPTEAVQQQTRPEAKRREFPKQKKMKGKKRGFGGKRE